MLESTNRTVDVFYWIIALFIFKGDSDAMISSGYMDMTC